MKALFSIVFSFILFSQVKSVIFSEIKCDAITEPNNDPKNCNVGLVIENSDNKCCWIKYKLGQSVIEYCKEISNNGVGITNVKDSLTLKNYNNIDIQCFASYLSITTLLAFSLLFL